MNTIKVKLCELKHPEKNIRMHTPKQLKEFVRSIEKFGQIRPIVVDENNVIWCGNGLYEAMKSIGLKEADCLVKNGLSEKEKKKLMLADNRIFDLGVDDTDAFDDILSELGGDFDIPGYDEDLLKSFMMQPEEVDSLISDYGKISPEQTKKIRETHTEYEKRDEKAAEKALEYVPTSPVPVQCDTENEKIDVEAPAVNVAQPVKEPERRYIICPKCGERIWL